MLAEEFWIFVFSAEWNECKILRICDGDLLDHLNEAIFEMTNDDVINTYIHSTFDSVIEPIRAPLKKPTTGYLQQVNQ